MATKKANISRESVDRAKPFLVSSIRKNSLPMIKKILNAQFPMEEKIDGMSLLMFAVQLAAPATL